jgi:hypothetical protein
MIEASVQRENNNLFLSMQFTNNSGQTVGVKLN